MTTGLRQTLWRYPRVRRAALAVRQAPVPRPLLRRGLRRGLAEFNDVLVERGLLDRCWVVGGVLLGWAREGRLLDHDLRDADFFMHQHDLDALQDALAAFARRGFRVWKVYTSNDGVVREVTFRLDRLWSFARFDINFVTGEGDEWVFYMFGTAETPVQFASVVPQQPLEHFSLLGRTWSKVVDHDRELTAMYGTWQIPDADFEYFRDGPIKRREPWHGRIGRSW